MAKRLKLKPGIQTTIFEYAMLIIGTTLISISINLFYATFELVTGGFTGLSIIIRYFTQMPIWLTNLILNAPLFVIGFMVRGKRFMIRTLFSTLYLSLALYLTGFAPKLFESSDANLIIASVIGGAIGGSGLGIVFRYHASTGGSDLVASILHNYFKHISIAKLMLVIDALIVAIGFAVFGPLKAMYAIIAIFISSRTIDSVLEGLSFAKAAFIISEHTKDIASNIIGRLDRGATILNAKGVYSGADKEVILCVVSKREIIKLKELTKEIDSNAFIIVTDVREVLGEGFE